MAATVVPSQLRMVAWSEERSAPGQTSELTESGRRYIVDTGVRVRRGTVTYAAPIHPDVRANEATFEAWHNSLNGDDNQTTLVPYAGIYGGESASVEVTAQVGWLSIADATPGSTVVLTYSPTDADLSAVLVPGAFMTILGRRTTIQSVTSAPSGGSATVVTADRLPAQSRTNETQLDYDWSTFGGATGMGAAEAAGGRLVVPVQGGTVTRPSLVFADINTGTPDLTTPVGTLADAQGNTWFFTEHAVSGIAALPDGSYFVVNAFQPTLFVVVGVNGQLTTGLGVTNSAASAALIATSATAVVPGSNKGAAFLGGNIYVVDNSGRVNSIARSGLFSPADFTGTGSNIRFNLDYIQATPVGRIPNTLQVAGMWVAGGQLRVLRRVTAGWQVDSLVISGGTITPTTVYRPTTRPFTGGAEIGGALYAPANNRIYRYTFPASTTVELGAAATSVRANILATGVQLRREGQTRHLVATYPWEEII